MSSSFVTMPRQCEDCGKTFAHRQSLCRHKKRCKGSTVCLPFPAPLIKQGTSSDDHSAKLEHLSKLIENADDTVSPDTNDDSVNDETIDDDSFDNEEFCDDEERYVHHLWIMLCIKCFKHDLSIYECMFRTLTSASGEIQRIEGWGWGTMFGPPAGGIKFWGACDGASGFGVSD